VHGSGLFKDWDCSIGECHLLAGDTIVLYTDGVTESFNATGEEYGEQRLTESVAAVSRVIFAGPAGCDRG